MDLLEQIKNEIGEGATEIVIANIRRKLPKIIKDAKHFVFTEEEAAAKLHISPQTLAKYRKEGVISFTWLTLPTKFIEGIAQNGRPGYMDHHLLDFLLRHETKIGKQKVTVQDTLGNVLDFPNREAA